MDVGKVVDSARKNTQEVVRPPNIDDTVKAFVRHISLDLRDIMLKELNQVGVASVGEIAAKPYVFYMTKLGAPSADLINSILAHHYGCNLR